MKEEFQNKIKKSYRKFYPHFTSTGTTVFRLYDKHIPAWPFIIDHLDEEIYIVYTVFNDKIDTEEKKNAQVNVVKETLKDSPFNAKRIIFKERSKKAGKTQYEKIVHTNKSIVVKENETKVIVKPYDYLDYGIFIDHRPLRQKVKKLAPNKLLNLFCYTSVFSLHAALKGSHTTNVDLSKTYLDWSKENFLLNKLDTKRHRFIKSDVQDFLQECNELYDLIILDPPTFSVSKKKDIKFNIQDEHIMLIKECASLLTENGVLYFSTNMKQFRLSYNELDKYRIKDLSKWSIPLDVHQENFRFLYEIKNKIYSKNNK